MAKKLTTQEFIEKALVNNPSYDYSNIDYINGHSEIEVICSKGHRFSMLARSFYRKVNCPECSRLKYKQEFINKARKIHGDKYNYDSIDYINNDTPVNIECPIHGIFPQRPNDHLKGYGCSKCSGKYKPTTEEWIEKASTIYNNKYDYSKVNYIDNKTDVIIICHEKDENGVEHGEFKQLPNNHVRGLGGCPKCRSKYKHFLYSKSTEQFIEDSIKVHGNHYDYSKVDYINNKKEVIIICPKHGEFEQTPASHLCGYGCHKCKNKNQTRLFEKLQDSFPDENILYEVGNKTVPWITNQRLDIYFPDYNIAVEYDGQQHFIPIEYFGGELTLNKVQERDKLKDKKCEDNNCILFRVKYNYTSDDYNELVNNIEVLIRKAKRANLSKEDKDYKALGKYIFKVFDKQDNREPEYVQLLKDK